MTGRRQSGSVPRRWASADTQSEAASTGGAKQLWPRSTCTVHIVTTENRKLYERELEANFRLRHHVYVNEYGWDDFRRPDGLETDQYDNAEAIYLLAIEDEGRRLVGGARLVPTLRAPVLREFSRLSGNYAVPRCPHTFHLSRTIVIADRREHGRLNMVLATILCALQEYCLAEDIEQLTMLARLSQLPIFLSLGWNPQPLGLPEVLWGRSCSVFTVDVSEHALHLSREASGITGSVLVRRGITWPAVRIPAVSSRLS